MLPGTYAISGSRRGPHPAGIWEQEDLVEYDLAGHVTLMPSGMVEGTVEEYDVAASRSQARDGPYEPPVSRTAALCGDWSCDGRVHLCWAGHGPESPGRPFMVVFALCLDGLPRLSAVEQRWFFREAKIDDGSAGSPSSAPDVPAVARYASRADANRPHSSGSAHGLVASCPCPAREGLAHMEWTLLYEN